MQACSNAKAVISSTPVVRQRVVGPAGATIAPLRTCVRGIKRAAPERAIKVSAQKDFDTLLMDVANQFEKSDNKVAIVGWFGAAFSAIVIAEWFIHLPAIDVLLGFPIQFIGLIATANLALRYYVDKEGEPLQDVEALVNKVVKKLPGL